MNLLERNTVRSDIDCPGDTISYNCSILSNSETVHLIWNVEFPGLMPISIAYDNTSVLNNLDNLAMNINTTLSNYIDNEYIESIIVLTVLRNVIMNRTRLVCGIGDLENTITSVIVNTSGKFLGTSSVETSSFN